MEKKSIESILRQLGMEERIDDFEKESLDLELLKEMSDSDLKDTLKEMKFNIGSRMKLMKAVTSMKTKDEFMTTRENLGSFEEKTYRKEDEFMTTRENLGSFEEKTYRKEAKEEIRIVLLGKTGSGKSSTANTILGEYLFESDCSGTSVTSQCTKRERSRFEKDILMVDTPGIFDTTQTNEEIKHEIKKCVGITAPGPHAFILVLSVTRYTKEELDTIDNFFSWFGEKSYEYFIILFTSKERLDSKGRELKDHIETCPDKLKSYVEKCGNRVIAFNNLLPGESKDRQVKDLLSMISKNIARNEGKFYTNEMYNDMEAKLKKMEEEKIKKAEEERKVREEEIRKRIKSEIAENLKREASEKERKETLEKIRAQAQRELELLIEERDEDRREARSFIRDEIEEVSFRKIATQAIVTGVGMVYDYFFG